MQSKNQKSLVNVGVSMLYWIAINRSSYAMCQMAMPKTVMCNPIPEKLIGFPTFAEASEAQRICLHQPLKEVRSYLSGLSRRGDVKIIAPANPEPPTKGETIWYDTAQLETEFRKYGGEPTEGTALVKVVPTPGQSYEEDMSSRDQAAAAFKEILAMGGCAVINLHANLDDREISRCIARYRDVAVQFVVDESDSTPEDRLDFLKRWAAAGGPQVMRSSESHMATETIR